MRSEKMGHDQELPAGKAESQKWLRGAACVIWRSRVDPAVPSSSFRRSLFRSSGTIRMAPSALGIWHTRAGCGDVLMLSVSMLCCDIAGLQKGLLGPLFKSDFCVENVVKKPKTSSPSITRFFFFFSELSLKKIWRVLIRQRSQITLLGNTKCALKWERDHSHDNLNLV